jgi:D-alanine-D-alanine ligase-like ATP-grasp enzyme
MKLAPKVGARVIVEPEWKYAAQIVYPNGVIRSLRYFALDLNRDASTKMAKDKYFAKFFLKKLGYPVAPGQTIFEKKWAKEIKSTRTIDSAHKYAKQIGYPLIVKPNSKNQGTEVSLVSNQAELKQALRRIFEQDQVAILEKYMPGLDYRIVVLENEIISAYQRVPLSVVGDGEHSILQRLKLKQQSFKNKHRNTTIDFEDPRIKINLRHKGYSLDYVPSKSKEICLLHNANLSTGGDAIDVTRVIHKGFKKIAIEVTKKMGLKLCGVDLMITKGDISKSPKACIYYIIEINAVPGLNNYVSMGKKQKEIVEAMYLKVLKVLGKKD